MVKAIKHYAFIIWATLWVWFDELGKMLGEMSLKDFAKLTGKIFLYGLSVFGWLLIITAFLFLG